MHREEKRGALRLRKRESERKGGENYGFTSYYGNTEGGIECYVGSPYEDGEREENRGRNRGI